MELDRFMSWLLQPEDMTGAELFAHLASQSDLFEYGNRTWDGGLSGGFNL